MAAVRMALGIAAAAGVAALAWYLWPAPPAPLPPVAKVDAPRQPPPAPVEHHPVPPVEAGAETAKPLPALEASDAAMQEALAGLVGSEALQRFLRLESLLRHIVVTIDNLPRKGYSQRLSPAKPVGGLMVTTGGDDSLAMAPENAARYAPWVATLERVDARRLVAAYVRLYPLFQQAYVELGYPTGHFNTRLVQVIDHLLTAPVPAEPLRLAVPHVLYEYADPALEGESAGRKVLFRIGNANAAKVKAKLREIRRALVDAR